MMTETIKPAALVYGTGPTALTWRGYEIPLKQFEFLTIEEYAARPQDARGRGLRACVRFRLARRGLWRAQIVEESLLDQAVDPAGLVAAVIRSLRASIGGA